MSIEVQNISKNYGEQKALDSISFSVRKGEIVGFLGPNGAGKSTLMKILTTYLTADSGVAIVNGYDVTSTQKEVQKSVGYLPEHNPLYLDLYVREYLAFNADVYKVAKSIPFSVVRKESSSLESLESLLLGQANLLSHDFQDSYAKELQKSYAYLVQKYQLQEKVIGSVEFFKHRPDNFPTIRLAQLANLYFHRKNLFSLVMNSTSISELYQIFNLGVSKYWETHYNFDKESSKKMKKLSKSFIDLLVINTIIPLRFAYARSQNKEITQESIDLATLIPAEQNVIIEKFKIFGLQVNNVYESQALLELKKNYCDHKKCLDCTIGHFILKK